MSGKYCRICWNQKGWKSPSGEAKLLEDKDAYVSINGFGHEEWILDFSILVDGYKYGFLQPLNKVNQEGRSTKWSDLEQIMLYCWGPDGRAYAVGIIHKFELPTEDDLADAVQELEGRGWFEKMKSDLAGLVPNPNPSMKQTAVDYPLNFFNIKFKPEDYEHFPELIPIPPGGTHFVATESKRSTFRYSPFDWDGVRPVWVQEALLPTSLPGLPELNERGGVRGGTTETQYKRIHAAIQNRMIRWLALNTDDSVLIEAEVDGVDVSVISRQRAYATFFEVKISPSARLCIREALGQLFEYGHFPSMIKAHNLVVVGPMPMDAEERKYLEFLRTTYKIPLFYANFSKGEILEFFPKINLTGKR